ncbi:MAG: addiction module antidote protein, partial [Dolichospermum sp.]
MAAYLEAALEDGDPNLVVAALGDIARSKGMTNIARETGLGRESLYQSLSIDGNNDCASLFPTQKKHVYRKLHRFPLLSGLNGYESSLYT